MIDSTLESINRFSKKVHSGYWSKKCSKIIRSEELIESVPIAERRQGAKRKILSLDEKFEIASLILNDK